MTNVTAKAGTNGVAAHVSRNAPAVTNIPVPAPDTAAVQVLPAVENILLVFVHRVTNGKMEVARRKNRMNIIVMAKLLVLRHRG